MPRIIRKIAFQPFLISMLVRSRTKPGPRLGLPPDSSNAPLLELVIAHRHPQFVRTLFRIRPDAPCRGRWGSFVSKCRESTPNQRAAEIDYCQKSQVPYPVFPTWSGGGQACPQQVASKVSLGLETCLCPPGNENFSLWVCASFCKNDLPSNRSGTQSVRAVPRKSRNCLSYPCQL